MHIYPVEFIIIKRAGLCLSAGPRAVMDEKPLSPLFSVRVCVCMLGGGTNDWCIIHRNKDEILDKVFMFFYIICITDSVQNNQRSKT